MTDEEMIKAMEICVSPGMPCDDCPLVEQRDCDEISRQYFYARFKELKAENAALCERLEKAVELPPGDRVWYIAKDEEGQESYIIPKPTISLTVEELKYEMDKKYFSTREAAEERQKKLQGGEK